MSNHGNNANLIVIQIDKGDVNEASLIPIFENDSDFSENEEYFREDTLEKGYENEAERVSEEIFNKHKDEFEGDERGLVDEMVKSVFEVENFIGQSGHYGNYTYNISESEFTYIIAIAYVGD